MRKRLLGGLVATTLAVTIGVFPARPAQAAFDWVSVVVTVASAALSSSGGGGGSEIEAAKREILAALQATKTEINNHIDAIANADVQGCVRGHTLLMENIDLFSEDYIQIWAADVTLCATQATEYFRAVQSLAAADNIAFLMGEIYAIAMLAYGKIGWSVTGLLDNLIAGYEAVVAKLTPPCTHTLEGVGPGGPYPGNTYRAVARCTAYNGDFGMTARTVVWPVNSNPFDTAGAQAIASRNTSRPVAQDALPRLRALRP
ncbi:hypothetical protein K1W54_14270 [Micromonospora sp. CPCC 205371]|nr:hypothetical protein [Micromonospora sp. CPCC 205371]